MKDTILADDLGPRGRRRVLIGSILAALLILAVLGVGIKRFADNGQFAAEKWEPLTQWAVLKFYLGGLGNTLKAAGAAMVIALAVGGVVALARLARLAPVRWLATLYVEFFRGMALYLLILFCWQGLPRLGVRLDVYWYLVIGLSVYNSAVLAEVFRAGILSLDRGQSDAASALGMRYWQSMGLVIVPQAVRRMLPAIISQLVTLLKDTSLGVLIFYEELLRRSRLTYEFFQNPVAAVALVALIYILVNATLSLFATRLEARQRRRYRAGTIKVTGVEQLAVMGARSEASAG
ncbi:MAG TPA: amino acid ABC transporter permease [Acidimicrobiales bacterium]|nr:amino acid ABC transporter permease [Acidimicrobiales bacterium]